jgi:branched-chain amino acid transport system ATP-binding protein
LSLLSVEELSISFAGLKALSGVTFSVAPGQIVGLIGPNGAGKTTLLNCVTRLYKPDCGRIGFSGKDLIGFPVHAVAPLGITRTFQNLELFGELTVLENVAVSCMSRQRASLPAELLSLPNARRSARAARAEALAVLTDLGLATYADERVGTLAYGVQKNIELARALAGQPKLILLDEPAAGLNPEESVRLGARIRRIREDHAVTILLIEHDMRLVMETCDWIVVLDHGEKISEGTPEQVQRDPVVRTAYLGSEAHA